MQVEDEFKCLKTLWELLKIIFNIEMH